MHTAADFLRFLNFFFFSQISPKISDTLLWYAGISGQSIHHEGKPELGSVLCC